PGGREVQIPVLPGSLLRSFPTRMPRGTAPWRRGKGGGMGTSSSSEVGSRNKERGPVSPPSPGTARRSARCESKRPLGKAQGATLGRKPPKAQAAEPLPEVWLSTCGSVRRGGGREREGEREGEGEGEEPEQQLKKNKRWRSEDPRWTPSRGRPTK
ncbi:unnamed protein product, partial [Prorocentrum cordatum]